MNTLAVASARGRSERAVCFQLAVSHVSSSFSWLVSRRLPSAEKATWSTVSLWPGQVKSRLPVATSNRYSRCTPATASVLPSGVQATAWMLSRKEGSSLTVSTRTALGAAADHSATLS